MHVNFPLNLLINEIHSFSTTIKRGEKAPTTYPEGEPVNQSEWEIPQDTAGRKLGMGWNEHEQGCDYPGVISTWVMFQKMVEFCLKTKNKFVFIYLNTEVPF